MIKTVAVIMIFLALSAPYAECGDVKSTAVQPAPLIIDHTSVAAFDRIPKIYLDKAKQLTVYYIHMSHGKQIITGLEALAKTDPAYRAAILFSSVPGLPSKQMPPALRMYRESMGPESYWSTESGLNRTKNAARMRVFNVFLYSWCGEMSTYSAEQVRTYLERLHQLETEFSNTRFIYMTGHVDGGSSTLRRNNQLIRNFAKERSKVLFDFADIESYDPAGKHYSTTGRQNGECTWCPDWCAHHPADCTDLPISCGHSDGTVSGGSPSMAYVCKLKAKAFWVMMARLAGWDGK